MLKKYKVNVIERFPSPFFWNNFRGNKYILEPENRIIHEKRIQIDNDPNTKVIIFGSWEPYAHDYQEYTEYQKIKERKWHLLKLVRKGIRKREIESNIKFNNSLNIPVKWSSEIKQVLSGLSENSWGDARKKNTVNHIYLHEDLNQGRLKRKKGDYLCSQVKAKWGGNWSGTVGTNGIEIRVDCKSCLKIAERFKLK